MPTIERSKNSALKACYLRPSTAVTHITAAVRMLLNQADLRSLGESDQQTVGMERAAKCMHVLVTSPPVSFTYFRRRLAHDHPRRRPTRRALSNSRLAAVYLWLAIAKVVSRCPGPLKLFDAAKTRCAHTHLGGIKQLQSFERRRELRHDGDKLTVGIGFHSRTFPAVPPLVFV